MRNRLSAVPADRLKLVLMLSLTLVWVTDRVSGGVACLEPDDRLAALVAEAAL